jgi:hypothetical protein
MGFALVFSQSSCRKDRFLNVGSNLGFNTDTVYFDTVFTRTPGTSLPRSRNLQLIVRNPEKRSIRTSIKLAGGAQSSFRINIDGQATTEVVDYAIRPQDSIFIFVECILEANNLTQPAIVLDSILFNTNGVEQDVKLAAYGWDAYYFRDSVLDCNSTWDKLDKPYVIVNSAAVDENCRLTIKEGVHVYSSANSRLFVLGTLNVEGTASNPVTFEGDRLQFSYKERPGQWRGIYFVRESKDNNIKHALIKNATIGIQVDSLPVTSNPNLTISHTEIRNMSNYGIVGLTAEIKATNCLIHSCGFQNFAGFFGGKYDVRHCTFIGQPNQFNSHIEPVFSINNFQTDGQKIIRTFDVEYILVNNIMWGTLENEVSIAFAPNTTPLPSAFNNNIIKVKEPKNYPVNNLINQDPLIKNFGQLDFTLSNGSPAINAGQAGIGVLLDFNEKNRDATPDIGAFEF